MINIYLCRVTISVIKTTINIAASQCTGAQTKTVENSNNNNIHNNQKWYMSHYTMIYKNGERVRDFLGLFISYCSLVFCILARF